MFELVANALGWGGIALLVLDGPLSLGVVMMLTGYAMALRVLFSSKG